jgi:spore germination cell wall hydrolase CwlJ-like protein
MRAAAFAVAAVALAVFGGYAQPSMAAQGSFGAGFSYMDHAGAGADMAGVSLNAAETGTPADYGVPEPEKDVAAAAGQAADLALAALPTAPTLDRLVETYSASDVYDLQQSCLAGAVYFEARGEPIEGQLAVAEVVINRARSGIYPASLCQVVTQKAQFSFIRDGRFPPIAKASDAWRKAVAIAQIAERRLAAEVPSDVLWYHADYVAPTWKSGMMRFAQIGAHIFYRRA